MMQQMTSPDANEPLREFDFLDDICTPGRVLDARIQLGPGDDLASVALVEPGQTLSPAGVPALVGVDQLVDGIHVDLASVRLEDAGRKAIARSVSDIAAMAGRPVATVVAALVPQSFSRGEGKVLLDAMESAAQEFRAPLVGGDLSIHRTPEGRLSCAVTVLAVPPPGGAVTRTGARPGDGLFVTGELGGGWKTDHHLRFRPRLAEATMLKAILRERLHAMIDISDGLGRDVEHLVAGQNLEVTVEAESLPIRRGFAVEHAVGDGEDYELAFAAEGDVPSQLGACPVHRIGTFTEGSGRVVLHQDGGLVNIGADGWEHGS